DAIAAALEDVGDRDVLVISGGVSAGRYDLVPEAVSAWGAELEFRGVHQKPGKPLLFARRGQGMVFGLPGNPLAAHLCFHRYVAPAVRALMGLDPRPTTDRGLLAGALRGDRVRTVFRLAAAVRTARVGVWNQSRREGPPTSSPQPRRTRCCGSSPGRRWPWATPSSSSGFAQAVRPSARQDCPARPRQGRRRPTWQRYRRRAPELLGRSCDRWRNVAATAASRPDRCP